MMVKASIVVPAYNAAGHLSKCLNSLLAQTVEEIEVIVVNDGSTDETLEIAKGFSAYDPRVSVIDQPNSGVSVARNRGMQQAGGEFLFFIDSDDWVEPDLVEVMVGRCEDTGAEVAIAGAIVDFHDVADLLVDTKVQQQWDYLYHAGARMPAPFITKDFVNLLGFPWNKCYRRDFLYRAGAMYDESLSLYEDLIFNVEVLSKSECIVFVPQELVHYVQRTKASLVKVRDLTFLTVKWRAIHNIDRILAVWGVEAGFRETRMNDASAVALWSALNGAVDNPCSHRFLLNLLHSHNADKLVTCALASRNRSWRARMTVFFFRRQWYRTGLFVAALLQAAKKVKARLPR